MSSAVEVPAAAEQPEAPKPMFAGTFAIYATPDGGLVLVTDVEGRGVEQRAFPAAMVKMLTGTGGGPLGKMARKMFGGPDGG